MLLLHGTSSNNKATKLTVPKNKVSSAKTKKDVFTSLKQEEIIFMKITYLYLKIKKFLRQIALLLGKFHAWESRVS